jgi:diguanylate cyclase (GGDEF)-like protein
LHELALALAKNIRSYDIVARIGGDEFVILFPETAGWQAVPAANKIYRQALHSVQKVSLLATISMGVATFSTPPSDVEEMVKAADDLMYSAKRNGKNAIKFWTEP